MLGYIDDAAKYLKAFDIFVLPSISESFGYVILEAGATELPVVASRVGGIPEIIDDMKTGMLVKPKSGVKIATALEYLLNNEEKRLEFGKALKQKISQNFTKEKMVEQTLDLYS